MENDIVDSMDRAAGWSVRELSRGVFTWSAWSSWQDAQLGGSPEVTGKCADRETAIMHATAAACSMDSRGVCLRVSDTLVGMLAPAAA